MKKKFIVEDSSGSLIGPFKTIEEARTYVEKDVAYIKESYETQDPQIHPAPDINEEWLNDDTDFILDIYDNFEYQRHCFTWNIKVLMKPQFTF